MNPNRAFPLDIPYRVRDTLFRWYAQTQMDMVRHRMTFEQLNPFLPTQIPDNRPDLFPEFPVDRPLPVLRYKYDVIFTVPSYV